VSATGIQSARGKDSRIGFGGSRRIALGRQLAEEARRQRPSLKVLYATAYAKNAVVHHGRLDPGVQLISKPLTPDLEPRCALSSTVTPIRKGRF